MNPKFPSEFVAILDVGHGNATVISTKAGTVVIDSGTGTTLHEFLAQAGITKIDTLALSHADQDHIGSVAGLLASNKFAIDNVFLNTDSQKQTEVWTDLLYELQAAQARGKIIRFSPALAQGSPAVLSPCGVTIEVCAPCPYLAGLGPGANTKEKRTITSNSISAVMRVSTPAGPTAILLGDVDDLGVAYLKKFGGDMRAPLIVFPHHGGLSGDGQVKPSKFTRAIMDLTEPSIVVFSIGRNHFRNPVPEIARSIRRLNPRCRIICTQLSGHCSSKSLDKVPARHLSHAFAAGRDTGISCGGTILIDLADPGSILPTPNNHRAFIKRHVPSPLCMIKRGKPVKRGFKRPRV